MQNYYVFLDFICNPIPSLLYLINFFDIKTYMQIILIPFCVATTLSPSLPSLINPIIHILDKLIFKPLVHGSICNISVEISDVYSMNNIEMNYDY